MKFEKWILLILLCWFFLFPVSADTPAAELIGPESVWERELFEVVLYLRGTELSQVRFILDFDRENLEMTASLEDPEKAWSADMREPYMIYTNVGGGDAYQVCRLQFRVREGAQGKLVYIRLRNVTVMAGGREQNMTDLYWERTVSKPVSDDSFLSELRISDAVLDQKFSPWQQSYTATVESHVASVVVTAVPREQGAQVRVDSPPLEYGKTSQVTVKVIAEDGSERVYTIAVTRKDSPERKPSDNCYLQEITVNGYVLSPVFRPEVTEYVLWLPYETTKVELEAVAQDSRATVTVTGNTGLKAGKDNPIRILCKAEDGTERVYVIVAKRAGPHETPTATQGENSPAGMVAAETPTWVLAAVAVAIVTGGAAVGILITGRKK